MYTCLVVRYTCLVVRLACLVRYTCFVVRYTSIAVIMYQYIVIQFTVGVNLPDGDSVYTEELSPFLTEVASVTVTPLDGNRNGNNVIVLKLDFSGCLELGKNSKILFETCILFLQQPD